ncbi:MAG: outer membrane lipoprotein carrier protein LolA, partial [Deltaproteobacteria bacterium]|nr:outer membrane lipoprotein carrier protein LolA [Deltaproteobacteria bacterium]
PVRSTGRFVYKRPDSLRWEYLEPMREGFAITGKAGVRWSDDGDGERRTRFSVGSDPVAEVVARQLMAWITFDVAGIRREYGIETLALDPLILRMTPLRDDVKSVIASITITFSAEGPASVVAIEESAGGKTTISFTGTVVNAPVADGDFD